MMCMIPLLRSALSINEDDGPGQYNSTENPEENNSPPYGSTSTAAMHAFYLECFSSPLAQGESTNLSISHTVQSALMSPYICGCTLVEPCSLRPRSTSRCSKVPDSREDLSQIRDDHPRKPCEFDRRKVEKGKDGSQYIR